MRPELQHEIDRLRAILHANGLDFLPVEPVPRETLDRIEETTGIIFDPDLRDFFLFSNGSGGEIWGAVMTDRLVSLAFPLLEEALCQWELYSPYDDETYEMWNQAEGDERDPRIRPAYLRHRLWFPVAEHNAYCTSVLFDADPAEGGRYGQLIAYQCDPDTMHYAAGSFLEFFRRSNDLLESRASEIFLPPETGEEVLSPEETESLKSILSRVARECAETHHGPRLEEEATRHGYADTMSFLFGHDEGLRIAWETAVLTNQLEAVEDLLERGQDVNARDAFGETPLITAAFCGHTELARLLLAHGADPSARDSDGETALDKARRKGHAEIVRLLEGAASGRELQAAR